MGDDTLAELEQLRAENELLKKRRSSELTIKVAKKGGVSVYGLNHPYPTTLYKEQWQRLLAIAKQIEAFIKENEHLLKSKP